MIASLHRCSPLRALFTLIIGTAVLTGAPAFAAYPDKPASWVVPFPPGGPTDVATRVLADAFGKALGGNFVVENKPGASGTIGVRNVIRSKPDGYTIGTLASPSLTAPFILAERPYDLNKDVTPIGLAYVTPLILVVNPTVLPDVIDVASLAKAGKHGKSLNYTSAGVGSTGNLTMELLKKELGFDAVHVPYQGSSPAVTAVLAGDVPIMLSDSVAVLQHIKAGKLRAIAVNTDAFQDLPDVTSLKAQGVQSTKAISWGGIFAPAGTPDDVRDTLTNTLRKVLQDPKVTDRMKSVGAYPVFGDAAEMTDHIKTDSAIWERVIKDNKLGAQ
ncbi:tripartite tricarboxylate transporter substrate binding protein [Pusillimonas sp. TS35]|uniref:Bug family tripartite tricarboxylate transporter substrate binding protein n=1 Tax=Paracandidimonas lactea TaxID=2895524 RepID=UPI0013703B91|nr:tripartite tricarboxylate transporter substrate binding protein [Paracandidimonas lactea]MYN13482.1 tripartite tricarboxylate transporter substrate binding protein [Pusillimonas sp. TS35]